jgi:radical SAM protein with 4Fe4S-binding SPASM domain
VGYAGGNVRDLTIEDIWNHSEALHYGRLRSAESLWGFCRGCYYADVCRGGCTWTADSLFGRPGNNPYCHHRVLELEKQGVRERVVKRREAPQESFAIGAFELIEEPLPGRDAGLALPKVVAAGLPSEIVQLGNRARLLQESSYHSGDEGRVPPRLEICRSCDCFLRPEEILCPFCGAEVAAAAAAYEAESKRRQEVIAELERLLAGARRSRDEAAPGGITPPAP